MNVDFIADYTVRINVPDQEPLTDEEFQDLAKHLAELFKSLITYVNGPPPGGYVEVSLNSIVVNGTVLNIKLLSDGESNAQ